MESPEPDKSLDMLLSERPKYKCSAPRPWVMTPTVCEEIDKLLKINEVRRASGMKKQTMSCVDLYDILRAKGYSLSYASLTRYMKMKKDGKTESSREAFLMDITNKDEVDRVIHIQRKAQIRVP